MEHSILDWSLRAALMTACVAIVLGTFRIRAASLRHAAWTSALIAMLLLPLWTAWGPSFTSPALIEAQESVRTFLPSAPLEASPRSAPIPFSPRPTPLPRPLPTPIAWQQIFLILYLAGVAAMLTRLIAGTLQVRSMLRNAGPTATTAACGAPVTVGWFRPVLLLPDNWREWPAAKLEAVLIHEREHIRRRDPLVQWLALLNRCIFWFHPVAWWLQRTLAALAEEACDAAVLSHGHAPADYARYLIEIARSVNKRGARVQWAGALAFSSGKLPHRIRRMMETPNVTITTRPKMIASAAFSVLLLAACLACNVSRSSGRAPAQPTMAERAFGNIKRMHRENDRRRHADEALWMVALSITPASATQLEADLHASPGDSDKLTELVRYYQSQKDVKSLDTLTLWYIANHPDVRAGWAIRPLWDEVRDPEEYSRGRDLWSAQLKKSWDSPYFYMNAAEFFSGDDSELAEQILSEGRRRFPPKGKYSGLHWEVFLARHYAWALTDGRGQRPPGRMVGSGDNPASRTPYAQKVRATLLASNDAELLFRTAEQLQSSNRDIARQLSHRVLSLRPDWSSAHRLNDALDRAANPPQRSDDAARLAALEFQLSHALARTAPKDVEASARELLALAARNSKEPNYGTAIFLADMILGEAALDRGDKSEAKRLMLAASDAPPTEYLRYSQIDLSLPAKLIDAGERAAVADFLDRCAKFNKGGAPLGKWAEMIRRGLNPELQPSFSLSRLSRKVS